MPRVLRPNAMSKCIGCFTCMHMCAAVNQHNHSIIKSAIRIKSKGGLEGKFVANVCRACREPACAEACKTGALTLRRGGGVVFNEDKCIGCGSCAKSCLADAVVFDTEKFRPIICKHCGVCARYCPHGCLNMEDVPVTEEVPADAV